MGAAMNWTSTRLLLRTLALPSFLFLAMAIGGALRDTPASLAILQTIACFALIWIFFSKSMEPLRRSAWLLSGAFGIFLAYALVQLIPLPTSIWTTLPGRSHISEAYASMGIAAPALPISIAPQRTLHALLQFLPAIAFFLLAAKLQWRDMAHYIAWLVPILACASALLGFAQVYAPQMDELYLRNDVVRQQAIGVMQVVNHNATLMLIAIPFLALATNGLARQYRMGEPNHAAAIFIALMFSIVVAGIVSTGSVAGYLLSAPTVFLSFLILRRSKGDTVFTILSLFATAMITLIIFLVISNPNLSGIGQTDLSDSPLSRISIYTNSYKAIQDHLPFGSGLGSFGSIYSMYEDPALITPGFIATAHNEYLEIALELGIPGVLALCAGLVWIVWFSVTAWTATESDGGPLRRVASIVCLIVLAHSLVDSPIRTQTVACIFGYCLGILALEKKSTPRRTKTDQSVDPEYAAGLIY